MVDARCRRETLVVGAAGPDSFTFEELLRLLDSAEVARARQVLIPASLGTSTTRLVCLLMRNVVLTIDEVDGMMTVLLTYNNAALVGLATG